MSFYSDHMFVSDTTPLTAEGKCAETMLRRDGTTFTCGKRASSVLHPPDQFRHWCSALEDGYDCMHFED